MPWRLRAEFANKERQEALVTGNDLDWTIIRPARLTNGPATGRLRAQPRLPVTIRDSISRADVAQFVLGELKTAPTCSPPQPSPQPDHKRCHAG